MKSGYGRFTAESARALMDRPVAMNSNLHNVLFEPKSLRLWVANATADAQPAAEQPYHEFSLAELLQHQPDRQVPAVRSEQLSGTGR